MLRDAYNYLHQGMHLMDKAVRGKTDETHFREVARDNEYSGQSDQETQ